MTRESDVPADERTGPWLPADAGQSATPASLLIAGRYELGPEIAHGGMGAVYRATDRVLGREVAVKLVREELIGTALAARFTEEARITGRLQHPGIPPVHELGQLPDGRPFLAMKLFRGRTLAAELATRAAQLAAGESSDDQAAQMLDLKDLWALDRMRRESLAEELRRLARIFEQVCQAVAYAHSQGVIHRDLKPANIMVAAFGEIQVMDWGLAKRLRQPATATVGAGAAQLGPETMPSDAGALGEADLTRPGAVMGTFAYMPPEQARGETEGVDARADVFALGAILCQILTGQPPYIGRTAQEVWQQAAAGELTAAMARLKHRVSDPDLLEARLVSLAIRCLTPLSSERPAHAGEVAVAVTAALSRAAESHRQAELNQVRTDVEMGYGRRSWLAPGIKAIGLVLLLAMIWFFGYAYRAVTVQEAKDEANKVKQRRIEPENRPIRPR
jgi:serine/threonine protein kinase